MTTVRGEWEERIGWDLATKGPTTYSGIMSGLGRKLGYRNGARKALGKLVSTNRVDHTGKVYKLLDLGALDLTNSLMQSGGFKNLSVFVAPITPRNEPTEDKHRVLTRSNLHRTEQVSFSAPASIGNVLSIGASALNEMIGSASGINVFRST